MKARLAKKLAQTSIDRLAPYWVNKFVCTDVVTQGLKKHLQSGGKENREDNVLTKI